MPYCGICGRPTNKTKVYVSKRPSICFDCRKERQKEYSRKESTKTRARERILQKKYGLSFNEYKKIFDKQGGVCAICGNPPDKQLLSVDHDHGTGKIRGLLCNHCNPMLGFAKDSISNLASAIKYLEKN